MKRLLSKARNPKVSLTFHLEKNYLHVHQLSMQFTHSLTSNTHSLPKLGLLTFLKQSVSSLCHLSIVIDCLWECTLI